MKDTLIQYFTPKDDSPNPQEVADVMAKLVADAKGERPLWSLVGAGGLGEAIDHINQSTKGLVDAMMGYMGV
jgi:hypothetical protein